MLYSCIHMTTVGVKGFTDESSADLKSEMFGFITELPIIKLTHQAYTHTID